MAEKTEKIDLSTSYEEYNKFVHYVIKCFKGRGIDYEDLFQAGFEGLIRGINRWNELLPENVAETTFLRNWVFAYAEKILKNEYYKVNVSGIEGRTIIQRSSKIKKYYLKEFGREPTTEELADELNVSIQSVEAVKNIRCKSIDDPISSSSGDDTSTFGDILKGNNINIEKRTDAALVLDQIGKLSERFDETDKVVFKVLCGEISGTKAGQIVGISRQAISSRVKNMREMIQSHLKSQQIEYDHHL